LSIKGGCRWPVYVWDSSRQKNSLGEAFGYLSRREEGGSRVTLHLLPYNYPRLIPLIKQAIDTGAIQGTLANLPIKWRPEFNQYISLVSNRMGDASCSCTTVDAWLCPVESFAGREG
jgi:hypothetical protein